MAQRVPKSWFYKGLFGLLWIRVGEMKDYVLEMESKFYRDMADLNKRYNEQIKKPGLDEEDLDHIGEFYSEQLFTIENVFLRTFRYSVVVSVYSFLETAMSALCRYLRQSKGIALELGDLRGEAIQRDRLYLQKVCEIDFPEKTHEWQEIEKLASVRNCIVHAQGNIHRAKDRAKIENIINASEHLALEHDMYIVVSREYIEATLAWEETFLRVLHAEAFKETT